MSRFPFSIVLLLLVAGCGPTDTPTTTTNSTTTLTGKVVSIVDGDTLTILVDQTQHKIRLSGIDCPEKAQPFGTKAKQFTADHAFGKTVSVEVIDTDRYGRTVGVVTLPDGTTLGHNLAGPVWRGGINSMPRTIRHWPHWRKKPERPIADYGQTRNRYRLGNGEEADVMQAVRPV